MPKKGLIPAQKNPLKIAQNRSKLLKIAQNGSKWLKSSYTCPKKSAQNCSKLLKMDFEKF
jgi:hypothetical protein